ncbi:MAG TPA: Xaa-Pro peptidase family protein [Gammaproteobacteria bacterium]|nr:Xaa-Pro peptidase family protein [Gammaproteobacteria bacterium]
MDKRVDKADAPQTKQGPSVSVARNTPRRDLTDTETPVDMRRMRAYRLSRVRDQLRKLDYSACVLFDPINIRYATGARNISVWTLHNAARYCFIPLEGPVVLFDFHNSSHLSGTLETVDEVRPTTVWFYFSSGPACAARAGKWAAEIADLLHQHGGGNRRLAIDHCNPFGYEALQRQGIQVHDGQEVLELARAIKSEDEISCMSIAIAVCETGMARMRAALEPGVTENQLWAILNTTNHEMGGEWIETRLLASGGRTNPWFQECSDRLVRAGELVSFDTDLIGPFGYCADISRTYFCGPGRPSETQRRLYGLAVEQVEHDMSVLKAGMSYRELSERAWKVPARYAGNRYSSVAHGVGMCDEYPKSVFIDVFEEKGYDGVYEPGMTVCLESYIGEVGGDEGVKVEQQVLITENGIELLSTFPYEEALLLREV